VPRCRPVHPCRLPWLGPRSACIGAVTAAAAVVAVVAGVLLFRQRAAESGDAPIDSIAVLPLENLSGDPAQEYFADGMTDLLTAELAQAHALKVIARTSAMQYKGARKPLPEIARELGVRGIIEGSVQRAGNRIRITALLIDGRNGFNLWAKPYDRDVTDVLSMQSEIAGDIVREVSAVLTPAERTSRAAERREVNPEAFELYLKGRFEWNERTKESLGQAVDLFTRSARIDPSYAAALAGLADAYSIQANSGFVPASSVLDKARAAAQQALDLDPQSAEAHAALGFILYQFDRDWDGAAAQLRRAMELNPNYANACQWYGALLFIVNRRDEGLRMLRKAVDLDPLAPRIRSAYAYYLFFSGRYQDSRNQFERTAQDDADISEQFLADLAVQNGDIPGAMDHARRCCSDSPLRRDAQIAYVTAAGGDRKKAGQILAQAESKAPHLLSVHVLVKSHAAIGDLDGAFRLALGNPTGVFVPYILGHPALEAFRRDPRYRDFLRLMKLEPYY
jgi:TolB-like protein/Flp pilus assembly protein TadD